MTDLLELLRAANPVPSTYRLDATRSLRIRNTILATNPGASRLSTWLARRRYSRLVLFASAAVLVAGCTAGAIEALNAQNSAPLTGSLPAPPGDTGIYSVTVSPVAETFDGPLELDLSPAGIGAVGWQVQVSAWSLVPVKRSFVRSQLMDLKRSYDALARESDHVPVYELPFAPSLAVRRLQLAEAAYDANIEIPQELQLLRQPISRRELPLLGNGLVASLLQSPEPELTCENSAPNNELGTPLVAEGSSCNPPARRSSQATTYAYVTAPDVAAVRLHFLVGPHDWQDVTVRTRRDPAIPDSDRVAVVMIPDRLWSYSNTPESSARPFTPPVTPLSRTGKPIPVHVVLNEPSDPYSFRNVEPPQDRTVSWNSAQNVVRHWPKPVAGTLPSVFVPIPRSAPPAACEIDTARLPNVGYTAGEVVVNLRAFPELTPGTPLSCAGVAVVYGGTTLINAEILLDARHPGSYPGPLPDAVPLPGHPGVLASPSWAVANPPYDAPGFMARRIGDAWLVIEDGFASRADKLYALEHLGVCVHVHGALCRG